MTAGRDIVEPDSEPPSGASPQVSFHREVEHDFVEAFAIGVLDGGGRVSRQA